MKIQSRHFAAFHVLAETPCIDAACGDFRLLVAFRACGVICQLCNWRSNSSSVECSSHAEDASQPAVGQSDWVMPCEKQLLRKAGHGELLESASRGGQLALSGQVEIFGLDGIPVRRYLQDCRPAQAAVRD